MTENKGTGIVDESKENNAKVLAVTKQYNTKFLNFRKTLEVKVKELKKKEFNKKERHEFFEDWHRIFTRFVQSYYAKVEPVLKQAGLYISSSAEVVSAAERWRNELYDTIWAITTPFDALQIGTWRGRLTEWEHAGYDQPVDVSRDIKRCRKAGNGAQATFAVPRKGISVDAIFDLKEYVFPFDPDFFEKIGDTIAKLAQKLGLEDYEKYDREHGTEHAMRSLENAKQIIEGERQERGVRINEHMVYTMVGFHDFWRASDIDPNLYNLAAEKFFHRNVSVKGKKGEKDLSISAKRPYISAGETPAKLLYTEVDKELNEAYDKLVGEIADMESSFIVEMFKRVIEGYEAIDNILKDAYKKKTKPVKKEDIEKTLKILREQIIDNLLRPRDNNLITIETLLEEFSRAPENRGVQNKILDELIKMSRTITYSEISQDLEAKINLLGETFKSLRPVKEFPTKRILEKSEKKALIKLHDLRAFVRRYSDDLYKKLDKKLECIEQNILHRGKVSSARSKHYRLGGEGKYSVGIFLDMLGYPFRYTEVRDYIKIHDLKYITPKTFEAQIAQDADMLDGIGDHAVKRTDIVGRQYGDKYFITEHQEADKPGRPVTIKDRFYYFEHGYNGPDTVSVILGLCFCWPHCLNTSTAKKIAEPKQKAMEEKLIRYSKEVMGLTPSQMKELKNVIKEFKEAAPEHSQKMINDSNKLYEKEGITGLYRIRPEELFE